MSNGLGSKRSRRGLSKSVKAPSTHRPGRLAHNTVSPLASDSKVAAGGAKKGVSNANPAERTGGGDGCSWTGTASDYVKYHDEEWGTPLYDDRKMFEYLLLETFQAGLSWLLILRKRENFRSAFCNFDVDAVATLTEHDVDRLVTDAGIIRHRGKIRAAISNARAVVHMRDVEGVGLADYFWRWVDYQIRVRTSEELKSKDELSDAIAKDLKKRGFKFIGSTVIYSHLQAVGIINDHHPSCARHAQVQLLAKPKPKTTL